MGGPKREFFRLFADEVLQSSYVQGGEYKVFAFNVLAVQVNQYVHVYLLNCLYCDVADVCPKQLMPKHIPYAFMFRRETTGQLEAILQCV